MKLQVAGFLDNTTVNGKGLRSTLFVSGCKHGCKGCQNKTMQAFDYGESLDVDTVLNRIKANVPLINGVTFSGGEPFEQAKALSLLAEKVKLENLNIWCYTGYTFEELLNSRDKDKVKLLKVLDVLIDGKFKDDLVQGARKYTGSKNQRIIDVKKSFDLNKVVEF